MRLVPFTLLLVASCSSSSRPTATVGSPVAANCVVALADSARTGREVTARGIAYCVPLNWQRSGPTSWRVGAGSVSWSALSSSGAPARGFAGPQSATEIRWRGATDVVSSPAGAARSASSAAQATTGGVNQSMTPPTRATALVAREWTEVIRGDRVQFRLGENGRGGWQTGARWAQGIPGLVFRGSAATLEEAEAQVAMYRTVRRTAAAAP